MQNARTDISEYPNFDKIRTFLQKKIAPQKPTTEYFDVCRISRRPYERDHIQKNRLFALGNECSITPE